MTLRNSLFLFKGVGQALQTSVRYRCTSATVSHIGVLGVPLRNGQKKLGVDNGPSYLRRGGILDKLEQTGNSVTDYGDLTFQEFENDQKIANMHNPETVGAANHKISKAVQQIVSSNRRCLSMGGDHSMAIGTVHGHAQVNPDLTLIWVDAHADLNPPLASASGNLHGMVLSFLLHETQEYIPKSNAFGWCKPCLRAKDIVYIGLRDIDTAERYIIEKLGIHAYTMHDIDRHGIDYVLEHAIDAVNPGLKRPIHLSFDIDALDPSVAPSTGTRVAGGLTIREGMYIAEEMAMTDKLSCMDLVEVNPDLGSGRDVDQTVFAGTELASACFGKRRRGAVPDNFQLQRPGVKE